MISKEKKQFENQNQNHFFKICARRPLSVKNLGYT